MKPAIAPVQPAYLTSRLNAAYAAADWPLLVRLCRQAIRKHGRHVQAHRMLGFALHRDGKVEAAYAAYAQAAALWPRDAELLINYADVLLTQGQHVQALPLLEQVVQLRPDHATCWIKLGQCCYALLLHDRGFDASQQALRLATDVEQRVDALTQSAIHRRELGQVREAVQDCRQAIALAPHGAHNYTNCLLFMLADPSCTVQDMAQVAHQYSERFEAPLRAQWPDFADRDRQPWRRLRVGFMSPDFRSHSVMYFAESMLSQLDRQQFEVVAFHLFPTDDLVTQRVQCHADRFIRLHGVSHERQAQLILDTEIDILIDLTGHTGSNALLTFARKPAPVQVSTLGYPGTTGLRAIDWWLTDAVSDPAQAQQWYTEQLYRLPTRLCYRPLTRNPLLRYQPAYQVRPTPALVNGYITFGSCNNLGKLTDEVLSLWGQLLQAVPRSRLLIEGKNLGEDKHASAYRQHCARLGIDVDRLDLLGQDTRNQYLTYHDIDIALDPFPLVGGTTTCDLLWMGVPLVTLNGKTLSSRMGVGLLALLGRHEWIARSQQEYLKIACDLAADVPRLNSIRMGLRQETEASVLMREDVYGQELGRALRTMWLHWLSAREHPQWTRHQIDAHVQQWWTQAPQAGAAAETLCVGVTPEERISLSTAYQRLQRLLDSAKTEDATCASSQGSNMLGSRRWFQATEMAERILCAKPHDAVALTVLAEIENAHGNLSFGRVYLHEAVRSLGLVEPASALLDRTSRYAEATLQYLGESSTRP